MKIVMEIIEKTEHENRRNQQDVKKLSAYKEAGAKCTDIMIILENGKIGKKNNREKSEVLVADLLLFTHTFPVTVCMTLIMCERW